MTGTNSGSPVSSVLGSSGKPKRNNKSRLADIPVVKKPNLDEYRNQIEALEKEVNDLHKKLDGVNTRISSLMKGNTDFQQKREDLRTKIDTIQQELDKLETKRNRFVTQIEDTARNERDTKSKIQGMKKAIGFQTSEEISEKIQQIERHMMAKRLTVVEENKLIAEMKRLEKSKPLVNKYATMETESNHNTQSEALQLRIDFDNIKDEIKALQLKKREYNDAFSALMQGHNKAIAPVRDLSDDKDQIKHQLFEKRARMNQLRDEMFKKRREFEAYQAVVSRAQRESMAEERKKRVVERQREEIQNALEEIEDEGWSPELQLMTQTVYYVKKLVERLRLLERATNEPIDAPAKEEDRESVVIDEDGMVAVKPKKDREEEYYFKPTKRKAEKKARKQPGASSVHQPLVHDITTLADFSRLGVEAPMTLPECPALLEVLEGKLDQIKKNHLRDEESVGRRKAELIAKLEALQESQPGKAMDAVSPVEIEAV